VGLAERFWSKVRILTPDECWPWLAGTNQGYGWFKTEQGPDRAHRVAWVLCNGPIPDGLFVLHGCDNRPCCNPHPGHLFLGTHQDNMEDKVNKGRHAKGPPHSLVVARGRHHGSHTHPERRPRGSSHGSSKLTEREAIELLRLKRYDVSMKEAADAYGLVPGSVGDLWRGKTWSHLQRSF